MTTSTNENHRDHADLALVVYLEELLRDRRVLLVGECATRVERRLSDAARTVDVVARERRARRRGLPVRAWPTPAEKGTWDAILIPDIAVAGLVEPGRFAEIAALAPDGIVVVGVDAKAEGLGYDAFCALVGSAFDGVDLEILAQAPLSGFALARLGAAVGEVAFDGSAAGEQAPARFVAIVAPRSVALDAYAVVATPREASVERPADPRFEREADAARTRLDHSEKRLEQAQREIARSAQKLDEARHEQARLEDLLRGKDAEAASASEAIEAAVAAADAERAGVESKLARAARELTELRGEVERRGVLARDLIEELAAARARGASSDQPTQAAVDAELVRLRDALSSAQRRAVEAEARRAELAFRVDELTADLASVGQRNTSRDLAAELASAEGALRGVTARVAELEELRLVAESRLALAEDDLRRSRAAERELERRLAETEEQLAMARMAPPSTPSSSGHVPASDGSSEREGKLFGALLKAREELSDLTAERVALVSEVARLRTSAESASRDSDAARELAVQRAADLERALEDRTADLSARSAELTAAREALVLAETARDDANQRVATLTAQYVASTAEITDLRARLGQAEHKNQGADHEAALAAANAKMAEHDERAREQLDAARARIAELEDAAQRELSAARARIAELEQAAASDETTMSAAADAARAELAHATMLLEELRGERSGLALRLADADAALDALRASRGAAEGAIEAARQAIASDLADAERLAADAQADATREARRATELAQRVAARDALVSRLTSQLAHAGEREGTLERTVAGLEQRLDQARESISALEAVSSVRTDEDERERKELEETLAATQARAEDLDAERLGLAEVLRDVRGTLQRLHDSLGSGKGSPVPPITDGVVREELARMVRDVEARDVMLRSLTAQLEERDDRIRALERMMRGDGGREEAGGDRARLLEADERIARLTSELAEERRTRERLESTSALVSREADLRRLEQMIGDRDAQLMLLEGRVEGAAREERVLRDAFAETRAQLESLLGDLGNQRGSQAAERAAELLRALRRF